MNYELFYHQPEYIREFNASAYEIHLGIVRLQKKIDKKQALWNAMNDASMAEAAMESTE